MKLKIKGIVLGIVCCFLFTVELQIVSAGLIFAAEEAKQRPIKIGWMAWTENEALMGTAKAVLEEKMGYKVEDIFLDVGVALESLSAGKIDVMFELCIPNYHSQYWDKISKD